MISARARIRALVIDGGCAAASRAAIVPPIPRIAGIIVTPPGIIIMFIVVVVIVGIVIIVVVDADNDESVIRSKDEGPDEFFVRAWVGGVELGRALISAQP